MTEFKNFNLFNIIMCWQFVLNYILISDSNINLNKNNYNLKAWETHYSWNCNLKSNEYILANIKANRFLSAKKYP